MPRAIVVFCLAAVVLAGAAAASRPATALETRRIRAAVRVDCGNSCRGWHLHYYPARISTIDRHFAVVAIDGTDASGAAIQGEDYLLWRGIRDWAALSSGTAYVGCGLIPQKIRREFGFVGGCP